MKSEACQLVACGAPVQGATPLLLLTAAARVPRFPILSPASAACHRPLVMEWHN